MKQIKKIRLKPSMLENKRYLLLDTTASKEEIEKAILDYIGILGWAKALPMFVKPNVLAVNREYVNEVKASFCICKKKIKVKKVSGTLRKLG